MCLDFNASEWVKFASPLGAEQFSIGIMKQSALTLASSSCTSPFWS
jgi:hypothetical protein